MRIAYLSSATIPSLSANSIQVMKMCAALAQLGHAVELVNPKRSGVSALAEEQLREHYGIREHFPIRWLGSSSRMKDYDYALRASLEIRKLEPDLVLTRTVPAAAVAIEVGLPTVLELHEPVAEMGGLRRSLFRRLIRRPSFRGLVVISEALRQRVQPSIGSPQISLIVCHDGIDLESFDAALAPTEARVRLGLPEGGLTIGYCGHLYPGRGIDLVLEIASRLPDDHFLVVGGQPEDVDRYRKRTVTLGLHNVNLTGFVTNRRVREFLAASDVLLMPYQRKVSDAGGSDIAEWMSPLKMFEYLASGRPIVSSDLPVLREVLDDSVALLCAPDRPDEWEAALTRLKVDSSLATSLGRSARERANRYSWTARARRIIEMATR